jgi:hypothetical protein
LVLQMGPLIAARARAREVPHTGDGYQKSDNPVHTLKELGKLAGVSHDTIHKTKVIAQEADEPTKTALRQGERSIHSVYQALRPPKGRPCSSVTGEGATAQPALLLPSVRVGPDASIDPQAPVARVTMPPPGHETAEPSVESPPRSDDPNAHQADPSTPVHRCLTLMRELYAEFRTMEDLHDMVFICQGWRQHTRAESLHQYRYLINTLQVIEQALHTTVANEAPPPWGAERGRKADPTPDDSGTREAPTGDGRTMAPLAFAGARVTIPMVLEARRKPEGDDGHSPSMDAEPTEPSDVSHAAVDPTGPMPTVGAKASAQAACDEGARQALDERIMATFPAGATPRRDEVSTFVRHLNAEAFPPPHGARTWYMAAMWQQLRALGYPTSGPLRKRR